MALSVPHAVMRIAIYAVRRNCGRDYDAQVDMVASAHDLE